MFWRKITLKFTFIMVASCAVIAFDELFQFTSVAAFVEWAPRLNLGVTSCLSSEPPKKNLWIN